MATATLCRWPPAKPSLQRMVRPRAHSFFGDWEGVLVLAAGKINAPSTCFACLRSSCCFAKSASRLSRSLRICSVSLGLSAARLAVTKAKLARAAKNKRRKVLFIMRIGLTTQAQRPGAREATIVTATLPPGSLQQIVRPHRHSVFSFFAVPRLASVSAKDKITTAQMTAIIIPTTKIVLRVPSSPPPPVARPKPDAAAKQPPS